ncbi:hypothetical protein PUNSTDRAFT_147038 [Punctularia strigosozonata HHB-11173 SS5]|uniref:Uncharacterized protein n=1 Tax=Punctularia strigosozonata (strain HHB-11173) TaxID=741275 RepID=R7S137_PUNST|nr:uncharacterized protein PUNSTDRAFT_147038 [Punctularia strigosozonata HHB-11173 SS5]EIN03507.1 hypothetical protein PUNSTDRAFT_147038 [Punctularia strigosozonata HHB-11173 SS5]
MSNLPRARKLVQNALPLEHFIANASLGAAAEPHDPPPYLAQKLIPKSFYLEVYGCQMNGADSDILNRILVDAGYTPSPTASDADIVLLITCAIRENAESKIWRRLRELAPLRARGGKVGLLGCMAERLKLSLLEGKVDEKTGKRDERMVDVVCGPDAYRSLPRLLGQVEEEGDGGRGAANVQLSADETYADITPLSTDPSKKTANLTIMRGCNNMCSYCIVPFTRGRERSRPITSILDEVRHLSSIGIKEITLLGQNVNSYRDTTPSSMALFSSSSSTSIPPPGVSLGASLSSPGFKPVYRFDPSGIHFAALLDRVSLIDPEMRIRFVSPHPQNFPHDLLQLIAQRPNLCSQIHMPAQSGSSSVLERMRRGYTRESYLELAHRIRATIPGATLSSDFIVGFCGETDEEFADTLSLVDEVGFELCFNFAYSLREKTRAHRHLVDDVPQRVKNERLRALNNVYERRRDERLGAMVEDGKPQLVLVTQASRRPGDSMWIGRSDGYVRCALPQSALVPRWDGERKVWGREKRKVEIGDYVVVVPRRRDAGTLVCEAVGTCSLGNFAAEESKRRMLAQAMLFANENARRRVAMEP